MRLGEATIKAGGNGKIKLANWKDSNFIRVPSGIMTGFKDNQGNPIGLSYPELTATDWEVVEPEIEVGDVVKVNCISYSGRVEVVSFRRVMAFVKFEDGDVREYSKSSLTLISKGPKSETFRGVKFTIDEGLKVDCILNQISILSPNKTYTMKLTEEG